jgi:ATP-dependent helicase/nuclease subunit A
VSELRFTEEQARAIARRDGSLLVSAGAGTGKTSVLVERFVCSVREDGAAVDSILAITFTEKAASQLKARVRERFAALGDHGHAREAEAAWVSTIHGFCARLLRAHALAAGIDPEFHVLDALEAERIAIDAFDRSLGDFLESGDDPERLRLLAAYTPDRLADMTRTAYAHLRSRGEAEPELPEIDEPRPGDELERAREAVDAALAEIAGAEGTTVEGNRARLERCRALLEGLEPGGLPEADAFAEMALKGAAKALKGPACEAFREAHAALLSLVKRRREHGDHVLLRELIRLFGDHYSRLKRERSGLDFDDLELLVRDLLEGDEGIREHYAERFSHMMVDEFQDTNPLQNRILELLERDNLFRVGDERQSIYRFRHADVEVFRRHRDEAAAAGRAERITVNFRSCGEVLDAIDRTFAEQWGEGFEALREAPGAREPAPRADPCVELLVTDKDKGRWDDVLGDEDPFGATMKAVTPWRAAEARLLARRIGELAGEGRPFALGDVVVLLRATTHMGFYERALEERGIPTHVLGGRGYWSQQQVTDLRAYLAALANPLDELALHSALASPLGGVSLDALVVLAAASRRGERRGLWRTIESAAEGSGLGLDPADAERLAAFAERFRADRAAAARVSLETLIDRAVTLSGYDREVLAMPAGERRMANIRKLMRAAREYEADEGRDLRGFIDFVAERDLVQEREGQAPLEAEDLDAVRLMTVHRAKGLEFPVVCVADLGKTGREDDSALRITDDGRLGMRLASLGGGAMDSEALAAIREQAKLDDEEEEKRVFYVAATRAREHLVLSGATDLEKRPEAKPLDEPMRWIWRALCPELAAMPARGESRVEYEGRAVRVRCEVLRPGAADELLPARDRDPAEPEPDPPGLEALAAPALAAVPLPDALPVSRLSYSGLESYARCGYRFYLEKALRLPGEDETPAPGPPEDRLGPLVRGSIAHALLERIDPRYPGAPAREEVVRAIEEAGEPVRDAEVDELQAMVAGYAASTLAARVARAESVRAELPFAYTLAVGGRDLLMNGVVDVHVTEPGGVLVVDYKTNALGGRSPDEITREMYSTQRLVYALAALRAGAERVEVAYVFLERPDDPVAAVYEREDEPELARRLAELAEGVAAGRFEPSPTPHRRLCAGCPGRQSLCSWGPELTLADEPLVTAP